MSGGYDPKPVVSLDRFNGDNWVALDAPQLLDSILLTAKQARALARVEGGVTPQRPAASLPRGGAPARSRPRSALVS